MDQSVGPRPVANGYTNARTNKLTLTQTQVKCFNSCQKTCKTHFCLSIPSAELPPGQGELGTPRTWPRLGFSAAGWQSSGREEVLGVDGGRDGGSTQPVAGATMASQSRERGAGSPGGSVAGRARCPLATYPIQRRGAIVLGTSRCGEAGRRNTSPGET